MIQNVLTDNISHLTTLGELLCHLITVIKIASAALRKKAQT